MAGKNKIMQAVVSFAGTIDPSLGKAMDNVAGHLDKVNWKAVAVGAAVGAGVTTGVGVGVVSGFGLGSTGFTGSGVVFAVTVRVPYLVVML